MELGIVAYALSFLAGALSTLSPCVLPLAPILLGTAVAGHRLGPFALAGGLLSRLRFDGLPGQFLLGALLGVSWSPCVGPTLGAAVTLASQGQSLAEVTVLMASFGLGAALPLVALGLVSRQAMVRIRGRLLAAGAIGKQSLGGVLLVLGAAILTGADKLFEAWALQAAPAWLVDLTTSL